MKADTEETPAWPIATRQRSGEQDGPSSKRRIFLSVDLDAAPEMDPHAAALPSYVLSNSTPPVYYI
jgi:hypothetical protein